MKTIFTLLSLAFIMVCNAQTVKFITNNLKEVRQTADSVALNAKRTYKFSSESKMKGSYIYRVIYKNVADTTDVLPVFFHITMKGANAAMELEGTPEYSFYAAKGKFLDLFPFWKKFVNTSSDLLTASKELNEAKINGKNFYFREETDKWAISMN